MNDDTAPGRCLCGAVRFEARGEPLWVAHCHCESCRRSTGAPVTTFVGYRAEQVQYLRGERAFYASSPGVRRGFCAHCGTPMTYEGESAPGEIHLYLCTLDEPAHFEPQGHVFYGEHVPWFDVADDLPRYESTSREGAAPLRIGPAPGKAP